MEVIGQLARTVHHTRSSDRPFVVGINGIEGSGKSTLSHQLAARLRDEGDEVHVISVDDFHRPRSVRFQRGELSPEGYRLDSIDFPALAERALRPLRTARRFPMDVATASWDVDQDVPVQRHASVATNAIVVVEGVFLFEPPTLPLLDLKVFLKADFDVILARVAVRDFARFGSADQVITRYRTKYIPGQQLYLDQAQPEDVADIVLDTNDPTAAKWLKARS